MPSIYADVRKDTIRDWIDEFTETTGKFCKKSDKKKKLQPGEIKFNDIINSIESFSLLFLNGLNFFIEIYVCMYLCTLTFTIARLNDLKQY